MNREVGLGFHFLSHSSPVPVINHMVSVDAKHHEGRSCTAGSCGLFVFFIGGGWLCVIVVVVLLCIMRCVL